MTAEALTIAFTVLKFILDRVAASDATKQAFQNLIEATVNDGLISKESHKVFVDQYHDVEGQLNASAGQGSTTPKS